MQQTFSSPPLRSINADASALSVAMLYDDFEAGKHAKRTYDYLVQALENETQFTSSMWKFDVLSIPKLREIAAKDAAMADIVIVSSHGGYELPLHVQMWADQWLAYRGNTTALVGLFDCSKEQARGVRNYLEGLARRGELEYFMQPDEVSGREPSAASPQPSVQPGPAQRAFETLNEAIRSPVIPRWGINE